MSVYISDGSGSWQAGDSNSLLPFVPYDQTLSPLTDPVNAMTPECRKYKVPACRSKTKTYPDIFSVVKMPNDRLNYEVDYTDFAAAVQDDIVQQFFVIDEGQVTIDGIQLVGNKVSFMLSDSSKDASIRLFADTQQGLRKIVPIQISS